MADQDSDADDLDPDALPVEPDEPDAGGEADEAEPDEQEEGDEEVDARGESSEERRPSRRDSRIASLTAERDSDRRRIADLEARLNTAIAARSAPAEQVETPQQREARRALLTPEERISEDLHAARWEHQRDMQMLQFHSMESADKAAFEAKATVDPLYRKWAPKVEAKLHELRNHPDPRQRANVAREVLLKFMIGEAALAARGQDKGKSRQQAGARVRQQATRPAGGRSDVQSDRGRRTTSLEKRLENVSI